MGIRRDMDLYSLLCESAASGINIQQKSKGCLPPGNNGPHGDPETPVRNTAYWLMTFSKAFQISGEVKFRSAAQLAAKYLLSSDARPVKRSFWCRENPRKDTCNGLIGQAWVLDSLIYAAPILEMDELISLAKEVFLIHPFNADLCLWESVATDGRYLGPHLTFNQQLWFCAAGASLSKYESDISDSVLEFLNAIKLHMLVNRDGLIMHLVSTTPRKLSAKRRIQQWIKKPKNVALSNDIYSRSLGYQSFNLYAFSIIKRILKDHTIWNNNKFIKALKLVQSPGFIHEVKSNKYSFDYNPTGLEMAFIYESFGIDDQKSKKNWLDIQISTCYNSQTNLMDKSRSDQNTLAARLCEAARIKNIDLSFVD